MKVAIIGAGNMGGAIARGIASGTVIDAACITVADLSEAALTRITAHNAAISTTTDNVQAVQGADIVLLAVKPWLVQTVMDQIRPCLTDGQPRILVSIAAGVDLATLEHLADVPHDQTLPIFRIIPNTAIDVAQSVNTIASLHTTCEQEALVLSIFDELGQSYLVAESQLNALMSLSSCGIAYAFRYIRAAMIGGVEMGIAPTLAKKVVTQTLRGAIDLIEANDSHPEVEIDKVTTPGGITIKGLNAMEAHGFTTAVVEGLKASKI